MQLAKKAVMLLTLVNATRYSDLATHDYYHIQWTACGVEFTVVCLRVWANQKVFHLIFRDKSEL